MSKEDIYGVAETESKGDEPYVSQPGSQPQWSAQVSREGLGYTQVCGVNNNTNNKSEGRGVSLEAALPLLSPASSLPPMSQLDSLVHTHMQRRAELQILGQQFWNDMQQHTQAACDAVAKEVNTEVAAALSCEKEIEMELKAIAVRSSQLQEQVTSWTALFGKLNTELKEMGDVSKWARRVERNLAETVHVLEELSEQKRRAQGIQ